MDADAVNYPLLAKLRTALNREQSLSIGISSEIIEATRHLSRAAMEEREAARRLVAWPDDSRRAGSAEDLNAQANAASDARRTVRQVERAAGRPIVSEQAVVRDLAAAAERAGVDVGTAVASYVRASAGDHQALLQHQQRAWEAAAEARQRAERQLSELEQERATHGRRAGLLRATLAEASRWMADNGIAMDAAA